MKHKIITLASENDVKKKQKIDPSNIENEQKQCELFTSLELKNLLKEQATQFQGLQRFCKACDNYNPENKNAIDIVKSYISSSPDCTDIFKCFRSQSSIKELTAIFKCLLHILNRTAGDLKESYEKIGYNICGTIIQSHLQKIYHALELRQSSAIIPLTLKLLTMLVVQSKNAARELANNVDFSLRCFKDILDKKKGKLGYEIKVAFVRFVLSFFLADDVNATRKILEVHGFVSNLFKGMTNDPASLVQLVITTLKERVVKNPLLSKTTKVRFFAEPKVLSNIAALLEWDGVVDVLVEEGNEHQFVRKLVYDFLYHVCCPFKCGINFKDKTLGVSEKSKNHVLLDLVFCLLQNSSNILSQKLIVEILKACPDLLPKVTADYRLSLDPKDIAIWLKNNELVRLIYDAQPDVATAVAQSVLSKSGHGSGDENHIISVDMLVKMTLPGLFATNFVSNPVMKHCMKSKSIEVKSKALELLLLFLNKAKSTISYASNYQNWEKSSYSEEEVDLFIEQLKDVLLTSYVSAPLIVSVWKECDESSSVTRETVLKVLFVLHEIFPEAVTDAKFDFTRLLFGFDAKSTAKNNDEKGQNCRSDVLILKMLAKSPQQYKWFKVIQNGQSAFRRLLQIIYDSQNVSGQFYEAAVVLAEKILVKNNVLDKCEVSEGNIWIKNLQKANKTHNDVVIMNYFDEICSLVVRKPVQYNSLLTSIQQNSSEKNVSVNKTLIVSPSFWDSIPLVEIKQCCVSDEKSSSKLLKNEPENFEPSSRLMSLLTVTAIDNLQHHQKYGSEELAVLDSYLCSVLNKIFHRLSSAEEAQGFVQIFQALIKNIPTFESSFVCLSSLNVFLSLWSSKAIVASSTLNFHGESWQCTMCDWFWKMCAGNKSNQGILLEKVMPHFDDKEGIVDNRILLDLSQILLYFDSLKLFQAEGRCATSNVTKEFLSVVVFLLKYWEMNSSKQSGKCMVDTEISLAENTGASETEIQVNDWFPYSLILCNPSVKDLFFKVPNLPFDKHSDFKNVKPEDIIKGPDSFEFLWSCIATDVVTKLNEKSVKGVNQLSMFYTTKVAKLSTDLLKELGCSKSSVVGTRYHLLDSFTKLCPIMPIPTLQKLFIDLASLVKSVNKRPVADFLSTAICDCTETLLTTYNITSFDIDALKNVFLLLKSEFLSNKNRLLKLAIRFLTVSPHIAAFIPESLVYFCITNIGSLSATLLSKLTQQNSKLLMHWCETFKFNKADKDIVILLSPVLNQVVSMLLYTTHKDDKFTERICAKILEMCKSTIFIPLEDSIKTLNAIWARSETFIDRIIILANKYDQECVMNFAKSFKGFNCSSTGDLEIVISIGMALISCGVSEEVCLRLKCDMICICINFVLSTDSNDSNNCIAFSHLHTILECLKLRESQHIQTELSQTWNKFLKHTLKNYFCDTMALKCVSKLMPVIYHVSEESVSHQEHIIDAATCKSMIMSHSKFLTVLLHEHSESDDKFNPDLKHVLLEILFELYLRCEADAFAKKDVGLLLGGYGCTLSRSDQAILKIILLFEQKNIELASVRPFLWGTAAVSSFRARKNLGDTLWKKPGSNEILSCLDSRIMKATLKRFPLRRLMINLSDELETVKYFENDKMNTISPLENKIEDSSQLSQDVYDPCFLLPALSDLLLPENLVDCKAFIQSGAMSFLMCCLASHCSSVRCLAASCLGLYYQHAQTAWFSENNLTMYLIRLVRNGTSLKDQNGGVTVPRLSSVVANFLSSIVMLHQSPDDHMFSVLHRFLLVKPQFDLKNVPEFYVLFFSAEMESKLERTWILNLISEGLRDMGDYHIIKKRNVFQLLMCLHDSPVSDNFVRRQIFQIFEEACSIRSCANDLVKNFGFVSWLSEAVMQQPSILGASCMYKSLGDPGKRQDNTFHLIRVLSTLWKSLNVCDFVADDIAKENDSYVETAIENDSQKKRAALAPFRVVKQVIALSSSLLANLLSMSNTNSFNVTQVLPGIHEVMNVLLSCLSNLDERRKQASNKKTELKESWLEDFCDLHENQIHVLHEIGELLIKYDKTEDTTLLLAAVFTFWTNQENENKNYNLWLKCVSWIFEHALPLCITDKSCVEKFLKKFFVWTEAWLISSHPNQFKIMNLLVRSYDLLFSRSTVVEETRIEVIGILNRILIQRTSVESQDVQGWSGVLHEMQRIRKSYWEKNS